MLKALGHPARIAIVEHLMSVQTCICSDLVEELPLAQATISQHLKELKSAGIIKGTISGTSVCYCLNELVFDKLSLFCSKVSDKAKYQNKCC